MLIGAKLQIQQPHPVILGSTPLRENLQIDFVL